MNTTKEGTGLVLERGERSAGSPRMFWRGRRSRGKTGDGEFVVGVRRPWRRELFDSAATGRCSLMSSAWWRCRARGTHRTTCLGSAVAGAARFTVVLCVAARAARASSEETRDGDQRGEKEGGKIQGLPGVG